MTRAPRPRRAARPEAPPDEAGRRLRSAREKNLGAPSRTRRTSATIAESASQALAARLPGTHPPPSVPNCSGCATGGGIHPA
jgi:hypothetical protein